MFNSHACKIQLVLAFSADWRTEPTVKGEQVVPSCGVQWYNIKVTFGIKAKQCTGEMGLLLLFFKCFKAL